MKAWPLTGRLSASVLVKQIVSWKQQSTAQPPTNAIRGANFLGWFPSRCTHQSWAATEALSPGNCSLPKTCRRHTAAMTSPNTWRMSRDEDHLITQQQPLDSRSSLCGPWKLRTMFAVPSFKPTANIDTAQTWWKHPMLPNFSRSHCEVQRLRGLVFTPSELRLAICACTAAFGGQQVAFLQHSSKELWVAQTACPSDKYSLILFSLFTRRLKNSQWGAQHYQEAMSRIQTHGVGWLNCPEMRPPLGERLFFPRREEKTILCLLEENKGTTQPGFHPLHNEFIRR